MLVLTGEDAGVTRNATDTASESDDLPTIPALPPEASVPPVSCPMPRLSEDLYREALEAAAALEAALDDGTDCLETVAPASAPLRVSSSYTVALLEIQRDSERAERALERVLARAPELSEAHYHLGVLQLRRGDTERAQNSFRRAAECLETHQGPVPPWAASIGARALG